MGTSGVCARTIYSRSAPTVFTQLLSINLTLPKQNVSILKLNQL